MKVLSIFLCGRLTMYRFLLIPQLIALASAALAPSVYALDGGTLRINPLGGWSAFEVISKNDDPSGDGLSWSMASSFDGLGRCNVGLRDATRADQP